MFNDVHFTGTVNLGAIVVALIQLISAIAVYFRVKALILEKDWKLKFPVKKPPPPVPPPGPPPPPPDPAASLEPAGDITPAMPKD